MIQFSVIVPTKNREDFLKRAVASVLAQTGVSFELLIVNDGEALQHHFSDHHVHVLQNAGRGAVPARNLGVSQAQGLYIAFLDDDDHWSDEKHLLHAFEKLNSDFDFYFGDGMLLFPDGTKRPFAEDATPSSLKRDNTILISAVCYKRALHNALGSFDEALPYYWDWDWYLRVAEAKYKFFHQPHTCVNIVVHAQNMSGGDNIKVRRANLDLLSAKHNLGSITLKNHIDFT
jgi:glycosyltransferase involved in cell wall biosynthesis